MTILSSPTLRFRAALIRLGALLLSTSTLALIFALYPAHVYANTIAVSGGCTLPDAIEAANTDMAVGGCSQGHLTDTLLLNPTLYSLSSAPYDFDGPTATPSITTTIIISGGNGATVERSGGAPYRLFHVGASGDLTLQKVTVRNGHEAGSTNGGAIFNNNRVTMIDSALVANSANGGGALYSTQISLATLTNSYILSNTAQMGGGIYNDLGSTLILTRSFVISNSASQDGGGIQNDHNSILIDNGSEFRLNVAGEGGALAIVNNSVANLISSQMLSNSASQKGGAAFISVGSVMTVTHGVISLNSAINGGGIYNYNQSQLALDNATLSLNQAQQGGAIDNELESILQVSDSHIQDNSASEHAGGIFNSNSSHATLANSDVVSNSAALQNGGGIQNQLISSLSISGGHILSNTAAGEGGGLYNDSFSTVTVIGTEIAGNGAGVGGGLLNHGNAVSISHTLFLNNRATIAGSAFAERQGSSHIEQSCISGNSNVAFFDADPDDANTLDAPNNWWGAPDGPSDAGSSGIATGAGDSVSEEVAYSPFLTNTILGCSSRNLAIQVSAQPAQVEVGATITYSYRITNSGLLTLTLVHAVDDQVGVIEELLRSLAPQESAVTTRTYIVSAADGPGPLLNRFRAAARPFDSSVDAANEFTRTAISMVDISGEVTGELGLDLSLSPNVSAARVGETITYTVRVANTGTVALQSIKITDTLLGANFSVGALSVGASTTRIYSHKVNANDLQAGHINNTVIATAQDSMEHDIRSSAGASVAILPEDGALPYQLSLPLLDK